MKSKKYAYVGIAAVAIAVIIVLTQFNTPQTTQTTPTGISAYTLEISYETVNSDLTSTLINQHINMSKPLKFSTPADINQYCNFLSNQTKQAMIEYCTSTELKDAHGGFLGNINMIGSVTAPVLVIAALQSDPSFSNYNDIKTVFEDVVNETICQCWDKTKPGGYSSLSAMMDAQRNFQVKGNQPTSTSHAVPLGGVHFEIDITTNSQGYVWKLLVAK
ncbi:MAG: hypothetical protein ACREA3_08680 [Nitrosotalea sp.]